MYSEEFRSLSGESYIEGSVIAACASVFEKNWSNTTFIVPSLTEIIFSDTLNADALDSNTIFNIFYPASGKILMPYCHNNHWRLFIINMDYHYLTLLDPFKSSSEKLNNEDIRIVRRFFNYISICRLKKLENTLTQVKKWNVVKMHDDRSYQLDGYNCGVYVIYYMNIIGSNERFQANFDTDEHRNFLAQMLLRESEDMFDTCLLCFRDCDSVRKRCVKCRRYVHTKCLKGSISFDHNECELCTKFLVQE